jgi:hypothetical protein
VIGLHREDKYLLLVAHATKDTKLNMHMSVIGASQPGMDLFSSKLLSNNMMSEWRMFARKELDGDG